MSEEQLTRGVLCGVRVGVYALAVGMLGLSAYWAGGILGPVILLALVGAVRICQLTEWSLLGILLAVVFVFGWGIVGWCLQNAR